MDKFAININIAGRSYRLKVDSKEEEHVRAATTAINKKIDEFSGNYAFKDKQDLLAMTAISFVSELMKNKVESESSAMISIDKLNEINDILS